MDKTTKRRDLSDLPRGAVRYRMTNDYMFRAVFQKNPKALKGLLCALLGLPRGSIEEVKQHRIHQY